MSTLGVVGLWHLGSTLAAAWTSLGHTVRAVDFDERVVLRMREGRAPLYEPGLDDKLAAAVRSGSLGVSSDPAVLGGCDVVFVALDTPVGDDDRADVAPVWRIADAAVPHLAAGTILVLSSQLPVGTSRRMRESVRQRSSSLEVVYSPENLRLGEALRSYLEPGHIVIGADDGAAGDVLEELFRPMRARCFRMDLSSAELVKHCINSFLATSVTLANHWSDLAGALGADYGAVVSAVKADPRIGARAYLDPGIGFSGGTLGRDLRALEDASAQILGSEAPLFGEVWRYNQRRVKTIAARISSAMRRSGGSRVVALGLTYKPGTSTLRRSLPLDLVRRLLGAGLDVAAHDPRADWSEVSLPEGLAVAGSVEDAVRGADLLMVLTPWPEYMALDLAALAALMRRKTIYDPLLFFAARAEELAAAGLCRLAPEVRA